MRGTPARVSGESQTINTSLSETKSTCGSDDWYCYPTDLVAYSSDYLCDDVWDEFTGQITADVAIENRV